MKNRYKITILSIALILCVYLFNLSFGYAKAPLAHKLKGREYKILLNPQMFTSPADGVSTYWHIVENTASQMGVVIKKLPDCEKYETRYIKYLDTIDHSFKNKGYIVRARQKKDKKKFELSLKYRSNDIYTSAAADVKLCEDYKDDIKFEEDISAKGSQLNMASVFSLRNRIKKIKELPGKTLKDYARVFPVTGRLDIDPSQKIIPVNSLVIKEMVFSPALLDFGNNMVCPVDFSVWKIKGTQKLFAAEFSFKNTFKNPVDSVSVLSNISGFAEIKKINSFFLKLNKNSLNWKLEGTTKTNLVYSAKP